MTDQCVLIGRVHHKICTADLETRFWQDNHHDQMMAQMIIMHAGMIMPQMTSHAINGPALEHTSLMICERSTHAIC